MKSNRLIKFSVFLFLFFAAYSLAWSEPLTKWTGKVVGISDGDTITVMKDGKGEKIRLAEIDCPEKAQPFGAKAKKFTSDLSFGKEVTVAPSNIDKYGRIVAQIILPDGTSLNDNLVKNGFAWQYKAYSSSKRLADIEAEAKKDKAGLWADANPVAPWKWRHGNAENNTRPDNALVASGSATYHGNLNSRIFHSQTCRYFNCKNCTAVFNSREEAINAGYRPCKICSP
ncbi:MAG: nuclease [Desulfobacterium sp.]|nr:nuclease [Desulfobacterium sp.]MBU3948076.1 thermonuclease family protein [Pseudomonadota bacterium]MBU4034901.1 thermonuclease family protein [Pseudomonadota bacterium]